MKKINRKKIFFSLFLISMSVLLSASSSIVLGEEKGTTSINAIRVEKADSPETEIVIEGEAELSYRDFKIAKPPMIVIEVVNAVHKVDTKKINVNKGIIKSVRSSQFRVKPESTVRVVIDLAEMGEYEVNKGSNSIVVKVKQPNAVASETKEEPQEETKVPVSSSPAEDIQKKADTAPSAEMAAVTDEVKKSAPAVKEAEVKEKVKEEETEVKKEEPIEVEEGEKSSTEEKTEVSKEQTISLDFKDADIRDVLKVLSLKSGINMVYGDDVKGEITVHLDKVNFQDALNIILRLAGLTHDYLALNVMRIMTPTKIKEEQSLFVAQTGIFGVNYAKASELQTVLTPLLSSQGKIQVDVRTNSIMVTDIQDNIRKIVEMLKVLDVPTPQVMIEAQIVSINKDSMKDIGVNWKFTKTWSDDGKKPREFYDDGTTGEKDPSVTGKQGRVDVTKIGAVSSVFSIGKVVNKGGEWTDLTAALGALESKGKGKVLSSPKVATLNNQPAYILSGQKVSYRSLTTASSGNTSEQVNFVDVGVKLEVTPSINMDRKITLKIHAEVSSLGVVPPGTNPPLPPINTRSADTNILAANGETLVIGGLIDEQVSESLSRIPFIGEIPILGQLFSHKSSISTKTELLVFITPHIM